MSRILARWHAPSSNWGDALNPFLIESLSGTRPTNVLQPRYGYWRLRQQLSPRPAPEHLVVGSILAWGSRRPDVSVVWGAGFITARESLNARPREIRAVRGPLSRARVREQGFACPDVFGDPALLMPRFYQPDVSQRHLLGVIPHESERGLALAGHLDGLDEVCVIDICGGTRRVVDQILGCSRIASSSLHGLIAADAYGVPSLWIELSDRPAALRFKYQDYLGSVGRRQEAPFRVTRQTGVRELCEAFSAYEIDIDLERLLDACPFRQPD